MISFIKGCHHESTNVLVGLREMHIFKFYVQDIGWHITKYKKRCIDQTWLPPGGVVRMWQEDMNENLHPLEGIPYHYYILLYGDKVI